VLRQNCGAKCRAFPARKRAPAFDSSGLANSCLSASQDTSHVPPLQEDRWRLIPRPRRERPQGRAPRPAHLQSAPPPRGRRKVPPALRPPGLYRAVLAPLLLAVQLLPQRIRRDPPPPHWPRPSVWPPLAEDRLPGGAAPNLAGRRFSFDTERAI